MVDPVFSGILQQTHVDMFELELLFGFLFFSVHLSCSESCFCQEVYALCSFGWPVMVFVCFKYLLLIKRLLTLHVQMAWTRPERRTWPGHVLSAGFLKTEACSAIKSSLHQIAVFNIHMCCLL